MRKKLEVVITDAQLSIVDLRARGMTAKEIKSYFGYSDKNEISQYCSEARRRAGAKTLYQLFYWYGQDNPSVITPHRELTSQEHELLSCLKKGKSLRESAKKLKVSPPRVTKVLKGLIFKFKAKNKMHLMFLAGVMDAQKMLIGHDHYGWRNAA